jgi:hypothetical protein
LAFIFLRSRRNRIDHRQFHRPEPGELVRPKPRKKVASK